MLSSNCLTTLRKVFILVVSMLTLCSGQARSQSSYAIPFGNGNKLVYQLQQGTYSISWKGAELISNAGAIVRTGEVIDSRTAGEATVQVSDCRMPLGKAKRYTVSFSKTKNLRQVFYVLPGQDYILMQLEVSGNAGVGYMAPMVTDNFTFEQPGDNRALYVPFDNDMWARFNAKPLSGANFRSSEVTAVYNTAGYAGFVAGSLEQDKWKSGVEIRNTGSGPMSMTAYAGFSDSTVTHDVIPHGKVLPENGSVCSPMFMAGFFSDWRQGMETFASVAAKLQPRVIFNWDKPTPMGWNSWGMIKEKLTYAQATGVVNFFADSLKGFRTADKTLFIDLDAFWDNMTPGGIGGDVSKLKEFVALCKKNSLKPGIYWTPFADWGKWDNKIEGTTYTYAQTWTKQNGRMLDIDGGRAMDPTHPATRQRIVYVISRMKELGFEMIKIDFLGHGAQEADHFYDPSVTTGMQAYTSGMTFLDSVLGKQMLVYAAISPTMATARFVHMRRIACDAWSTIDHTEYTLNSTGYGWWQSHLYNFMDADHVVFDREDDGVNRARLASALVTGSLITGDDYSAPGKWKSAARTLLQNPNLLRVTANGKSFRPVNTATGDRGVDLFTRISGSDIYLAGFNFSDKPRSFDFPANPDPLKGNSGWIATNLFTGKQQKFSKGDTFIVEPRDAIIFLLQQSKK
ncbi:MAG: alpha-galactosidase [Chitinophagaceae bacterium]|nr:MAG: alpha-galactosidase [Chitinophagaceae bacterium]